MRHGAERPKRDRYGRQRGYHALAPVYAAVDLGTNNCRMLAARPTGHGLRVIDSFSRIVRLGEGMSITGRLADTAVERTIDALKVCAGKMRRLSVRRSRNIATEACRRAANSGAFLERAKAETGLVLESIAPAEEARLIVAGCAPLLDARRPRALIFDIGGGSTEVIWIERTSGGEPRVRGFLSVPRGVMTVAERYGCGVLPAPRYAEIVEQFDAELEGFDAKHGIAAAIAEGRVQMLGTSGTVTTLGGIHLGLSRYDRSRVDGQDIPLDAISGIIARLTALSVEDRALIPCVGSQRADLMVAGCAILEAICRRWPAVKLRVADRGIREGLLLEMMAADGTGPAATTDLPAAPPPPIR